MRALDAIAYNKKGLRRSWLSRKPAPCDAMAMAVATFLFLSKYSLCAFSGVTFSTLKTALRIV
jgi:hypothetical protein